jgi:hypothetical protein
MCAGFSVQGLPIDVMYPAAEILQVNSHSMCRRVNKAPSRVSLGVEGARTIFCLALLTTEHSFYRVIA